MIEETFREMVLAQSEIYSLIADRIYPKILPQNPVYPCASFKVISGPRDYTQEGDDGVPTWRIQVDLYDLDDAGLCTLRDTFITKLSGHYNAPYGSPPVRVQGVFVLNQRSGFESAVDSTPDGGPYRHIIDFAFTVE